MPDYVYHCRPCRFVREESHSIHEDPLVYCVECGDTMSRRPQAAGIILKGSGFHSTEGRPQEEDNG